MILPTNKRDNILTKALLKLYSYKIVSSSFHECGDYEPFYALTCYIPVSFDLKKEIKLFNGIGEGSLLDLFDLDSFYNDFLSNEIKWSRPSFHITEINQKNN